MTTQQIINNVARHGIAMVVKAQADKFVRLVNIGTHIHANMDGTFTITTKRNRFVKDALGTLKTMNALANM